MFYNDKIVFIHIPKNGGTSIRNLIYKNSGGIYIKNHPTFDEITKINPSYTQNKVSFCIIRNPFDRFISIFRFNNQEKRLKKIFGESYINIKDKIDTLEKFISNFEFPKDRWLGKSLYTPQALWANNVQNIFKIEDQKSLKKFLIKNGIKGDIPLENSSGDIVKDNFYYREFYTKETKKFIQDKFQEDLEKFNYNF